MMRTAFCLIALIASVASAAAPASSPSSAPATESLLRGAVTFTPPSHGWELQGKLEDGKTVAYSLEPNKARMAITVTPQELALDDAAAARMSQFICKRLREDVAKSGAEVHTPPRAEKDDRFFLRVHDRFTHDGQLADRLQICRVLGIELVTVAVTAYSDSPEEVDGIFKEAEQLLLSVRAPGRQAVVAKAQAARPRGPASKPVVLEQAKLRITPPPGWRAELTDNAAGIVATFRDPDDETNLIAVSVRPLPKQAQADPKVRDILVDEIVAGEQQQFKIDGAQLQGTTQTIKDNRFLRKTRTNYQAKGKDFQVGSRQVRIGNAVISVSTVCLDDQAEIVERLADEVAANVRSK